MRLVRVLPLILAVIVTSCASPGGASTSSHSVGQAGAPVFRHVFLIVLENREYDPQEDPSYLAGLATNGAVATNYYAITHPSLPNYLALLAGETFGVVTDTSRVVLRAPTLVDQLGAAGLTWGAFMEGMPKPCFKGVQDGEYVERHNPFMYFASIRNNPSQCKKVRPLPRLLADLAHGTVPNFVWITPNLCDDGHDCGNDAVNAFLQRIVPQITASPAYHHHGVLFITHDEGTSDDGCCQVAHGGRVETVFIADPIRGGPRITAPVDHYGLLRTIEDGFGLPHLGNAACVCASRLGSAWQR